MSNTAGPRPRFDEELAAVLPGLAVAAPPTITAEMIPGMRRVSARLGLSDEAIRRGGAIDLERRTIPGAPGGPGMEVLICRPAVPFRHPFGVYHLHGGGMFMGDARTGLSLVLDWVQQLGATVVSPEYRLAPEHPHPAPSDDCYAGLLWVAEQAGELGFDAGRLVVAGASAGGGLAAAMALMARDRDGPGIAGQVLMCPMLDDRSETISSHQVQGEGVWDRHTNVTAWDALLGAGRGTSDVSSSAAPARAATLADLPPALLDVGSVDVLRDETVTFASRIWAEGGSAELHVWPGGFHGFDLFAPRTTLARVAHEARVNWLRRLLGL